MQAEGLTLTGLAARLGKSPGAVSDWLTGRRAPDVAKLADVSARTGGRVTPGELRPDIAALFVKVKPPPPGEPGERTDETGSTRRRGAARSHVSQDAGGRRTVQVS